MNTNLTVYSASAGSGKTFRLAVEYIKLLLDNPESYRNILAVTFTNKATGEMKTRILQHLYGISRRLPDSKDYLKTLEKETGLGEQLIIKQCDRALQLLVNNFNYFHVVTIDAFFQTILRNMARELELNANLSVNLNDSQVEEQAVDELIQESANNSDVINWVLDFINDNIQEDKSWNVLGAIKRFGMNIFDDTYKENQEALSKKLEQKGMLKAYKTTMQKLRKQAEDGLSQAMKKAVEDYDSILTSAGVSATQLIKNAANFFERLRQGTFEATGFPSNTMTAAMSDGNKWLRKADQSDPRMTAQGERLAQLANDTNTQRLQLLRSLNSAVITLRNLNQLSLLNDIRQKVADINTVNNRFQLSSTQELLYKMIDDSDAPFIFEKTGSRLTNIMIDEFQDTSRLQWENFKVLLKECMSKSSRNIIVGDVKQSIYRWRGGDWSLLSNIGNDLKGFGVEKEALGVNYRSDGNIVAFNSTFFKHAVDVEEPDGNGPLHLAYQDLRQEAHKEAGKGYVEIQLLSREDYEENIMPMLVSKLQELLQNGVKNRDIAILVRKNDTISFIANQLMKTNPEIKLVSDEAFRLDFSQAVNILVSAMRVLCNPEDKLELYTLAKYYQTFALNRRDTSRNMLGRPAEEFLPEAFISQREKLLSQPIMDLAQNLYAIFNLHELRDQSAYVCCFFDQLDQFLQDNEPDLNTFLKAWDEDIHNISIQSDEADGIQLLTIHKSKGLEFDHVIIPACDWDLRMSDIVWCCPQEHPYDELPILPIKCESRMKESIYQQDYEKESALTGIDNMNMLYVAFTRASKNLYVYGKRPGRNSRSKTIEDCLSGVAEELHAEDNLQLADPKDKTSRTTFYYGTQDFSADRKKESDNVFAISPSPQQVEVESYDTPLNFRQSNDSKAFIEGDEESQSYVKRGNLLHAALAEIRTPEDLDASLDTLQKEGLLDAHGDNSREALHKFLSERLDSEPARAWFQPKWQLFNECNLVNYNPISQKTDTQRPDRVMYDGHDIVVVDYKFGVPKEDYYKQVRDYMSLLRRMGYQHVKGYLWYVYQNKIQEVTL